METVKFTESGLAISRIGFGCMSLPASQNEADQLVRQAFDIGITYFDTADVYSQGQNERILGNSLKGIRSKIILATKGGNVARSGGHGFDWDASPKYLKKAVESSLKKLGTDYIDYYQLHGGTMQDDMQAIVDCFESMKQQGKIKAWGISSIRPNVIAEFTRLSPAMAGVMTQYSLLDSKPEEQVFPLLALKKIPVFARGVLASGKLLRPVRTAYLDFSEAEMTELRQALSYFQSEGCSPAKLLCAYVLSNPAVICAVLGFSKLEQLAWVKEENEKLDLAEAELHALGSLIRKIFYKDHRL